ncbi:hypothetical protein [Thermocrinis minervae]|uniref:ODP domain-containing protein n=1 Tax=Thermocrinis minervae TaxID=381751 RepID=A0A1M6RYA0_9AQUI|nr:hypothetical protein [Thermocrinis minervae]SHK37431.1 hypothetical protein SAMN05444391_0811 [Thermocrinis minervae]
MGISFLLFDKERKYSSTLGDILTITGHKLLIALEEDKAYELLKIMPVDVFLADIKYLNFWVELLKQNYYLFPIFFAESYDRLEDLKKFGLSDYNIAVVPFNPLDFLAKVLHLVRKDLFLMEDRGPMNELLDVMRRDLSTAFEISAKGKSCKVYIKDGKIKGFSCNPEVLRDLFQSQEYIMEFFPYEEDVKLETYVKNNSEFFSLIFAPEEVHKEAPQVQAVVPVKEDLNQAVVLADDALYWVGNVRYDSLLQRNAYLRVYKKENVSFAMLYGCSNPTDYSTLRLKIESVIGPVELLKAVVVFGNRPEDYVNAFNLLRDNPRLYIITSVNFINDFLSLGVPVNRIRFIESFVDGRVKLSTGDVLRFIKISYVPDKGSFVVYEENTGFLFTGELFSSYASAEDFSLSQDPEKEMLLMFNASHLPCTSSLRNALSILKKLHIKRVFPKMGNPVSSEGLQAIMDMLLNMPVGSDRILQKTDMDQRQLFQELIQIYKNSMSAEDFKEFLESLNDLVYVSDDGVLEEVYVSEGELVDLLISKSLEQKVPPNLLKELLLTAFRKGSKTV